MLPPPRIAASRGMRAVGFVLVVACAVLLFAPRGAHSEPIPPGPIDPNTGELSLLDLVNSLPINDVQQALDRFPVPYIVIASAGGADPVVVSNRAGVPTRIDADSSTSTGQGHSGDDLIVEVNTELTPTPHLVLSLERLDNAPYATDLQVAVVFPFDAFNGEDASAGGDAPNLFFGYQTTGAFDGSGYPAGGQAPALVEYTLTPGTLAGTDHVFDLGIATTGASNPIRYLAGHFDAPPGADHPSDAIAMGILSDAPPATINLGLDLSASAILSGGSTSGSFALDWSASAPAKVQFDYIEHESFPFPTSSDAFDYGTTVTFDQMPTAETLTLGVDFAAQTIAIDHAGNAPVGALTVDYHRADGLDVTAVASDVPTAVNAVLDFGGSVAIDVNANTMDFALTAVQAGGFPGSDALFGYPLGFLYVGATDVPDTTASWDVANRSFTVAATNPGEAIGSLAFVVDDDAAAIDSPAVQLPPDQGPLGTGVGQPWAQGDRHVFSIVDDGTHGTAAARVVGVRTATLDLDAATLADLSEAYTLDLAQPAHPLTAYLKLGPASAILGKDVEATCNVHDFPYGVTTFDLELPPPAVHFGYTTDPAQGIDEVFCVGHADTLNFEVTAGDLPAVFDFQFDPAGSLSIVAEDGSGGSDPVGTFGIRLWDETGPDGLGAGTAGLLGDVLRDARARGDDIPSFTGTWSDAPTGTHVAFDTAGSVFLGGAQVAVSTVVELNTPLAGPAGQHHYLTFADGGAGNPKRLAIGAFGIDQMSYDSVEGGDARTLNASYTADSARALVVDVDTALGGRFFPDYAIDATMTVDAVPQSWTLATDLATSLVYTGSAPIDDVTIAGTIGLNNPGLQTTHIDAHLSGAPAEVNLQVDPQVEGSFDLVMSGPLTELSAELWSDTSIFKQVYRHMLFDVNDVPAEWHADWGLSPNPHAFVNASAPMGTVQAVVSRGTRDDTPGKYAAFQSAGGAVNYSAYLREIDRRYVDNGVGGAAAREAALMGRLDALYTSTAQLDAGEDHLVLRRTGGGDLDFLSVRATGFQCASAQLGNASFQCVASTVGGDEVNASALVPVAGVHPFYVGLEDTSGKFTVAQIPDVPDSASLIVGPNRAHLDFSGSPGDILVYQGPLPSAGDFVDALKVRLVDTPSFVHVDWTLGVPGGVTVDSSNPFELHLLTQSSSSRTVAALGVGDMSATWNFEPYTTDEKCQLDPPGCGEYLQFAKASFNFDAGPPVDGFLLGYHPVSSPTPLNPAAPSALPGGTEYVPEYDFLLDGFSTFDASIQLEICLIGVCPIGVLLPNVDINTDLLGAFNVDWWDMGGGLANFLGDPDYFENNPWHLWPVLHDPANHLFPFGP